MVGSTLKAEKLKLNDTPKANRGPVINVRARFDGFSDGEARQGASGWYGLTVKQHKSRYNGEVFQCYAADFSDYHRNTMGKDSKGRTRKVREKGWMEFVSPEDKAKYEAWLASDKKGKE